MPEYWTFHIAQSKKSYNQGAESFAYPQKLVDCILQVKYHQACHMSRVTRDLSRVEKCPVFKLSNKKIACKSVDWFKSYEGLKITTFLTPSLPKFRKFGSEFCRFLDYSFKSI